MAKSKRSRRARRQQVEKQPPSPPVVSPKPEAAAKAEAASAVSSKPSSRYAVDFATEYYYIYTELRNIFVVALVMFAVMLGLSYFV